MRTESFDRSSLRGPYPTSLPVPDRRRAGAEPAANAANAAPARGPTGATDPAAKFAYNPALDGLRAIAIFFIVAGHLDAVRASNVAVDVFFVLSGFLITVLLLAEQARTGTVSIGRFLVRRAYRLMPAMWVFLLVGLAYAMVTHPGDSEHQRHYVLNAASAFLNVNNWLRAFDDASGGLWLSHVWSLSLEEQFYLLWPAFFLLCTWFSRLRPHLLPILGCMLAAIFVWRLVLIQGGADRPRIYFATDTHVDPLLIGCALAVWRDRALRRHASVGPNRAARSRRRDRATFPMTPAAAAAARRWQAGRLLSLLGLPAGVTLIGLAFLGPSKSAAMPNWLDHGGYALAALLTGLLIMSCDMRRDMAWVRFLGSPRMAWLGKITFGIYLWHYPVAALALGNIAPRIGLWPSVAVVCVISVGLAYLSSRLVEIPVQRRRPAWADTPRGPALPEPRPAPSDGAPWVVPAKGRSRVPTTVFPNTP